MSLHTRGAEATTKLLDFTLGDSPSQAYNEFGESSRSPQRGNLLKESLVLNDSMKRVYRMHKSEKFGSKIFNPPSIVEQMKDRGLYQNNPIAVAQPETRFKPQTSPIRILESNKKNI